MKPVTIAGGLIAGCLLVGVACGAPTGEEVTSTSSMRLSRSDTHEVRYKVGGTTSSADITISNGSGDSSQQSDISVPLRNKHDGTEGIILTDVPEGTFLYISAQNNEEYGTITCAIEVDGIPVKTNQSSGGYTIATCSGRL